MASRPRTTQGLHGSAAIARFVCLSLGGWPCKRAKGVMLLLAVGLVAAAHARAGGDAGACAWTGPSPEWVLAQHLPVGEVSGLLGADIIPYFHEHGIPVSFVSRADGDSPIRLAIRGTSTARGLFGQVLRQAPGYRYRAIEGRVVIYPDSEDYDTPVEVASPVPATRVAGLFSVLQGLKAQVKPLQGLAMPTLRGPAEYIGYGEQVEVGGWRSPIEHMLSLVEDRPTLSFRVVAGETGRLDFGLDWVRLVEEVSVQVPRMVQVGAAIEAAVTARLVDGSWVRLAGPACRVEYSVTREDVLTTDQAGRVAAKGEGSASILVRYEGKSALVDVEVQSQARSER
jgi:hypothetical protein